MWIGTICILIAGTIVITMLRPFNSRWAVSQVDAHMDVAYESYSQGTYGEATNALSTYIQFLENNKRQIAGDRDVDRHLYVAHASLGNMLLHSGNEIAACDQFNLAYSHHKQMKLRVKEIPIPRSNFVGFVIIALEEMDSKSVPLWKDGFTLETNIVSRAVIRFEALANGAR